MKITEFTSYRLIKGEDLNHHGSLIAGRCADWFLEAGYIAASNLTSPQNTIVLKINDLTYSKPARGGDVMKFTGKVIWLGRSKIIAHVKASSRAGDLIAAGFITLIHIVNGKSTPHGLSQIEAETEEDLRLQQLAQGLS